MIKLVEINFIEDILHKEISQLQNNNLDRKNLERSIKDLSNAIEIMSNLKSDNKKAIDYTKEILDSLVTRRKKVIIKLSLVTVACDKEFLKKCRLLLAKLKLKIKIEKEDINTLFMILDINKAGSITKIRLLEYIKYYNLCFADERLKKNEDFDILKMVNFGFERYTNKCLNNKSTIKANDGIKKLISSIEALNYDVLLIYKLLCEWANYGYNQEELENIIIGILNYYQGIIYEQIKLISDFDFYNDTDLSKLIKEKYEKYVSIYVVVRNYYNKIMKNIPTESLENDESMNYDKRTLLYSRNENFIGYIEKDLEQNNFPEEDLETVMYLLNGFKKDILMPKEIKRFNIYSICGNAIELRKSHVRIILKQIKDNYYFVSGVGIKKADNDRPLYKRIGNRNVDDVNIEEELEISKEIENRLKIYVNKFARKGR